ncbi:MAG: hypothetical protein JNL21_29700 [Myxococcales bacterium]|nr:hypothetical protein [Myxococcales bacterium]
MIGQARFFAFGLSMVAAVLGAACGGSESSDDGSGGSDTTGSGKNTTSGDGGSTDGGGGAGGQLPDPTPLKDLHLTSTPSDAPANLAGFQAEWDQIDAQATAPGPMVLGAAAAGETQSVSASEDTLTTPWRVALLQSVSAPLAAQSIAGELTWVISADQSAPGADFFTRVYLAVWTDSVHCVLADWTEPSDTLDWGLDASAVPSEPVTLEPCDVPEGARLVLELGYTSKNENAVSRSGTLDYGGEGRVFTFSQDILFR